MNSVNRTGSFSGLLLGTLALLVIACGSKEAPTGAAAEPEAICARITGGTAPPECVKGLQAVREKWPDGYRAALPCLMDAKTKEEAGKCIKPKVQAAQDSREFKDAIKVPTQKGAAKNKGTEKQSPKARPAPPKPAASAPSKKAVPKADKSTKPEPKATP